MLRQRWKCHLWNQNDLVVFRKNDLKEFIEKQHQFPDANSVSSFVTPTPIDPLITNEGTFKTFGQFSRLSSGNPRFTVRSAEFAPMEMIQKYDAQDLLMRATLLSNDGIATCLSGQDTDVTRVTEVVKNFLSMMPDFLPWVPDVAIPCIHVVLHAIGENAYFQKDSNQTIRIVLGCVIHYSTGQKVFEHQSVLHHELGHLMLRLWVPKFPSIPEDCPLELADFIAIDEGVADSVSYILNPDEQTNFISRLRSPLLFPPYHTNDNYTNGAFISAFVMHVKPEQRVGMLSSIVRTIGYIIQNNLLLNLPQLFHSLGQCFHSFNSSPVYRHVCQLLQVNSHISKTFNYDQHESSFFQGPVVDTPHSAITSNWTNTSYEWFNELSSTDKF